MNAITPPPLSLRGGRGVLVGVCVGSDVVVGNSIVFVGSIAVGLWLTGVEKEFVGVAATQLVIKGARTNNTRRIRI
jgi:hypothetical protein